MLQHSFYLITLILAKYQASLILSQPQDTIKSLDPRSALIQERDSNDFTNSEPADSIALQSDADTPSDEEPNGIAFDQTHLEGDNFVPSQSTFVSASVPGAEISQEPAGNSQDSAFLPWDGNEGVPDLIPNLPSLSLPSLPKADQIFENIMKGVIQPQEPDCDDGLFSFCCESGPPRSKIKKGTPEARVLEIEAERKQRLRDCVKCLSISRVLWYFHLTSDLLEIGGVSNLLGDSVGTGNKDHLACQFPENEACCRCLSLVCMYFVLSLLTFLKFYTGDGNWRQYLITFSKKKTND